MVETATEVVETDPATFTFKIRRTTVTATSSSVVGAYPAGWKPWSTFVNGLPERVTGSAASPYFVAAPVLTARREG